MPSYIRFQYDWVNREVLPPSPGIRQLMEWRQKLCAEKLIGAYSGGIGYGNISARENQFLITGSQTGHLSELDLQHFARVRQYWIDENRIECEGATVASAESLTHASLYEIDPAIGSVVHVHHAGLWKIAIQQLPTTPQEIEYGTPGMARAIQRLHKESPRVNVFAMGGHPEGLISFGRTVEEAGSHLLEFYALNVSNF
jgi:L-ribulose-5-phosphate 4-epimerase